MPEREVLEEQEALEETEETEALEALEAQRVFVPMVLEAQAEQGVQEALAEAEAAVL